MFEDYLRYQALEPFKTQSVEIINTKPPPPWLPYAITPDRCYVIIAQRRGGMGRQALSPPSSYQHLEFSYQGKKNSPEPKI